MMAYGLAINPALSGENDRVSFSDVFLAGDFSIKMMCELYNLTGSGSDGFIISGGNVSGGIEIYRRSAAGGFGSQIFLNGAGSSSNSVNNWPYYDGNTPNPRLIELKRVDGVISLEFEGVEQLTVINSSTLKVNTFGARSGGSFFSGLILYECEITAEGVYKKFDASLSDGAGNVLPTSDELSQGSLVNFPTDGSQWIEYDDGSGGEPVNYDAGGAITFQIIDAGCAAAIFNAGAGIQFPADSSGSASSGMQAGAAAGFAIDISGGASADYTSGGQESITFTVIGGADVISNVPQSNGYDVGGQIVFSLVSSGGLPVNTAAGSGCDFEIRPAGRASVSLSAGGAAAAEFSTYGSASIDAISGGAAEFEITIFGGAITNETTIIISRVNMPASTISKAALMPASSVNGRGSYQCNINARVTL